jgi:hypothetical protein
MIRNLNGAVSDWAILLGASRLEDDRGYFGEIFHQDQVNEIIGTEIDWKQGRNLAWSPFSSPALCAS